MSNNILGKVSVIIRTFNEEKHLSELLDAINKQKLYKITIEIIIVDSGSTDNTISIASDYDTKLIHINKEEFTFGRSLNYGCSQANGDYFVFISAHCVPINDDWLISLIKPLIENDVDYVYGRQVGNHISKYSECQVFKKYYPNTNMVPQDGFFCNNANAAINSETWTKYKFNEDLTGLEDMELAKRLYQSGGKIGYIADAPIYHIHEESWHKVKMRYQREAIALRHIMPEIHIRFSDFLRYYFSAVFTDVGTALQDKILSSKLIEILIFRLMQFWGSYKGNHEHRKLSAELREEYFYPK